MNYRIMLVFPLMAVSAMQMYATEEPVDKKTTKSQTFTVEYRNIDELKESMNVYFEQSINLNGDQKSRFGSAEINKMKCSFDAMKTSSVTDSIINSYIYKQKYDFKGDMLLIHRLAKDMGKSWGFKKHLIIENDNVVSEKFGVYYNGLQEDGFENLTIDEKITIAKTYKDCADEFSDTTSMQINQAIVKNCINEYYVKMQLAKNQSKQE